ncbi:MAG: hypothetical protein KDA37_04225 [Planctomycetales bacterium]|nr:hypothetical protein [Planctomycetales bacterium]
MESLEALNTRIESVLSEERQKIEQFQDEQARLYHERQGRLARYEQVVQGLIPLIAPRVRSLAERFLSVVEAKPVVREHSREITFDFKSNLASVTLKLGAYPDEDVRNIVFQYELRIIPMLIKFNSHQTLEQPLDQVDRDAVIKWFDDRIVDFIKTYISIYENGYYLKGQRVRDPVANVLFPQHFAAAKLDWEGETYYFVSRDTLEAFEREHGLGGPPRSLPAESPLPSE